MTSTDGVRVAAVGPPDGTLPPDQVRAAITDGLAGRHVGERVLVLVPDHTRTAPLPFLVEVLNDVLADAATVHVMVALGTHPPLGDRELSDLVGLDRLPVADRHPGLTVSNHRWRDDDELVAIGVVAEAELAAIAGDVWHPSLGGDLPLRLNRAVLDCDHVILLGPTFPHEVVGFSGGAKYFFPGVSGPEMIDVSHWLGALSGVVGTIGRVDTPTRRLVDHAAALIPTPVTLVSMVVVDDARLAGVFVGDLDAAWRRAAGLSATRHIRTLERPMQRVLSMAPPMYDELWTAAKAMYKLEPVLADDAELVIFAPHLREVSRVHGAELARVGYHVLPYFLEQWDRFSDVPRAVLAHSTHVRGAGTFSDGVERPRVRVTLSSRVPEAECRALGLGYLDPDSVDVADWTGREDGVLVVPRAGEVLYRLAER
ncbi:MAG TPA: lactate racemase domain-containing protein [Microthrixaceae bacterium]|nr:lactate racemase domain-containing protein [Microthrixaceae bacterium]